MQADPYDPRLKPITEDVLIQVGPNKNDTSKSWTISFYGDKSEYLTQGNKKECYGVIVVKSKIWPGAYTFYY